ncbi:MAG: polyphosphate polymerase domain-containing protein [Crocinitomicaceae bacterium]|nr:polyphosphate polymerase domain-containing protein [Crocinitomicaceae bacterium]
MEGIKNILNDLRSITLEEMQEVQLQNRIDTKFIFHQHLLPEVLHQMSVNYAVLRIENQRISEYESLYFDTENLQFYLDHHNKKNHRIKVRKRHYKSNGLTFFEIKEKRAGRTIKKRIPTHEFSATLSNEEKSFLKQEWGKELHLQATIKNHYQRITLVDNAKTERITLDLHVGFVNQNKRAYIDNIVIAELKQGSINRNSVFFELMRKMNIIPFRVSKYCVGSLLLVAENTLKYNRFKRKLLKLKKIANDFE